LTRRALSVGLIAEVAKVFPELAVLNADCRCLERTLQLLLERLGRVN